MVPVFNGWPGDWPEILKITKRRLVMDYRFQHKRFSMQLNLHEKW